MEKNSAMPYLNFRGNARQFGRKSLFYAKEKGKQNIIILGATVVLFILFSIVNSGFSDKTNIITMTQSLAPYAILGLGVTFVIATGGIDLSIGTVCIGSGVIAGTLFMKGMPLWLTLPVMLIMGTLFGFINGVLVAKLKLPAFIATLGTMLFARGISAILAQVVADVVNVNFPVGSWLQKVFSNANNFPISLVWVIGIAIVCMYVMYKCKVGRYILAIGSNEEAARLSGIKVDRYKIIAYMIAGLFAGIAAVFFAASNPTLTAASGNGMELEAIAGVYIGGTSASGGIASIVGSLLGAMILVIIRQGLNFTLITMDINISATFITYAITGLIVVGAVFMDVIKTRSMNKVKLIGEAKKYKLQKKGEIEALRVKKDFALSARVDLTGENIRDVSGLVSEIKELKANLKALKAIPGKERDNESIEEISKRLTELKSRLSADTAHNRAVIKAANEQRGAEQKKANAAAAAEIDAEILCIKQEMQDEIPRLKGLDALKREEIEKRRAEIKAAARDEKLKRN